MSKVYWTYESAIGDTINISIRAYKNDNFKDFYIMLGNFVEKYCNRINHVDEPVKLANGSLVTIIRLDGRGEINFENYR